MTARLRTSGDVWVRVRRQPDGRWRWTVVRSIIGTALTWNERSGVEQTAARSLSVGLRQGHAYLTIRRSMREAGL